MDSSSASEIHGIYSGLITGFTINHAKLYSALVPGEPKSAGQLIAETGISKAWVYRTLDELQGMGLVGEAGGKPTQYYANSPARVLAVHARKMREGLDSKRELLRQMMKRTADEISGEYLIRVTESHTKLINQKTRQIVSDEGELRQVRKLLEQVAVAAPRRGFAVYR